MNDMRADDAPNGRIVSSCIHCCLYQGFDRVLEEKVRSFSCTRGGLRDGRCARVVFIVLANLKESQGRLMTCGKGMNVTSSVVNEKVNREDVCLDMLSPLLLRGDCIEKMRTIPDRCVSLLLTDPPYNLGLFMKKRGTNMGKLRENHFASSRWDQLETDEWLLRMDSFFSEAARKMKKRGAMIVFMSLIKVQSIIDLAVKHGFYYKTTGVWHKTNPMPRNMNLQFVNSTESWLYFVYGATTGTFNNNGHVEHDFIETSVVPLSEKREGKHPTQKPIALMKHFVQLLTNEGDVVLDPFMGSGSSGVASMQLGRRFIGIELSSEYFQLSKKRMGVR